jgi:DNA polymerase-3 subunit gamma/tau
LLLIKNGCQKDLDFTAEEITELKDLAATASLEQILKAVKLFGQLELGSDNYTTLPLELALVDYMLSSPTNVALPTTEPIETVTPPAKPAPSAKPVPQATTPPKKKRAEDKTEQPKEATPPVEAEVKTETTEAFTPPAEVVEVVSSETSSRMEQLETNWKQVIDQAPENTKRTPAIAILRSAGIKPVAGEDGTVILTFKYPYLKDKIEETENMKVTTEIISSFVGHTCRVRCVYESDNNHLVQEAQRLGAKIIEVEEK